MFEKEKQKARLQVADLRSMMLNGEMSVARERYYRLRYGISEGPSHELSRIPMPAKTARVVDGLEAMLVNIVRPVPTGTSSLKRETLIDKLRRNNY